MATKWFSWSGRSRLGEPYRRADSRLCRHERKLGAVAATAAQALASVGARSAWLRESDYRPHACYRDETQARRLEQWLAGFSTDDIHLAGSSMGGAIAAVLAHSLDPKPRSVTLLNSAGIPEHKNVDIHAP